MIKLYIIVILNILSIFLITAQSVCPCDNIGEKNPVCASDNLTYINPGIVECRNQCERLNLKIVDKKPCPCNCASSRERWLVCANDGNTYINPSAVKCHNQCNYHKIQIVTNWPCRETDPGLIN